MSEYVVITGANRGIGLAFTRYYLAQGKDVIAVCRRASEELLATTAEVIEDIDVTNEVGVVALAAALDDRKISLLINNAGIFHNETLADMDFTQIQKQIEVNAIAPLKITHALLDNLTTGSKVALITSRMGSISDNGSGHYYGYRMSKAALNAAGKSLAVDLSGQSISVAILHPGFVQTDMVGGAGDVTPEQAVEGLTARISELNSDNSGTFWHANGDVLPW
ncbi:SDR family oxidoreductase [Catenovulum sp. SM1970]|uniref:SDR family oxidoreductase n=1 Tax=Marinifaba aquimaris TaxID=2741323 RepID=UPI001573B1DB|nr:SDR family oxidoreductase [Marinifaba aquimaris]NTS78172.1 SDR family oxidoreductase [Marinifaba aquimaris]